MLQWFKSHMVCGHEDRPDPRARLVVDYHLFVGVIHGDSGLTYCNIVHLMTPKYISIRTSIFFLVSEFHFWLSRYWAMGESDMSNDV